jgi:hypothetical protein
MVTEMNVRWSRQVKAITFIAGLVLIVAEITLVKSIFASGSVTAMTVAGVVFAVCLVAIACAPVSVKLDGSRFTLVRVLGKITLDYVRIRSVRPYRFDSSDIRVFGSGGFCGYTGIFSSAKIGRFYSYVGDARQAFLIETERGEKFVFSCENAGSVIETVKKHIS